jgi:hypothetical protein
MKFNARFTKHNGLWHVLITPIDQVAQDNLANLEGYSLLIMKKDLEIAETLLGPMCCQTKFQARYTIGASREEQTPIGYEGDGRYFDQCSESDDPDWEKV